jgi:hypothetical protein
VPDTPPQKPASRPARGDEPATSAFPREAYVFGWLVVCVVAAEGIRSVLTGVLGTGIILLALIPVMVWLMHIRPRQQAARNRRG